MRLWHYELISYLPDSQLLGQWRELNSIFVKQNKHILINYVYEYPKINLWYYSKLVTNEIRRRGFVLGKKSGENADNFFGDITATMEKIKEIHGTNPFPNHHTNRYLIQCFYNLQEKYDRGQTDFTEKEYEALSNFIMKKI